MGSKFKLNRKQFLFIHRWLGIISGIVVFIVALTGCIFVFEEEYRDIFQHKYLYVEPANKKQELATMLVGVKQQFPKAQVTQIRYKTSTNAAYLFYTKDKKVISLNPYNATVIGSRDMEKDFFNWVEEMHKTLHLGKVGKEIIRWNVLIFFILCISGLILWWPKQKRFWKQAIRVNFKTKNWKRFNWDLHSVLGFYALIVLFMISLTGMFWMFDWVKQTAAFVSGSAIVKQKTPESKPISLSANFGVEKAVTAAISAYPGASQVIISNPVKPNDPIRVLLRYPYQIVRKQNVLFFDSYSGALLKADLFSKYTNYDKIARSNFDFHTGRIPMLGIGSKIIYFLASLVATSLPITGIIIWLGRKRKKKAIAPITHQQTHPLKLALEELPA